MNSNINKDLNLDQINEINSVKNINQNRNYNHANDIKENNQSDNYYINNENENDINNNYQNNPNENYNINYQNVVMPDINDLICEQKQFIDDDYLLQLHQRLVQTRELRKISENGVKVLNGRVRCLKDENQKTLNKIYKTGKMTKEKLLNLERKKSQSKEKIDRIKKLDNELNILKNKNMNQKIDRDNGLINSRKKVISENKIKGQISKKEKDEICNIKLMNELNEKNLKKNKIEVIRSQAVQKLQKKKMCEIEKKEAIIKDLEQKINFEINKKKELEQEINKMLNEENETFERINKTNEMQKKIFSDFEKILKEGNMNNLYDNYYNEENEQDTHMNNINSNINNQILEDDENININNNGNFE